MNTGVNTDKKVLYAITISSLAVLLLALFLPIGISGRILASILLLPLAVITAVFVKKRAILSVNRKQVLLLMTVIGLVYVMLLYLSGIKFGFYKNIYRFGIKTIFEFIIPIGAIIVLTEIIRSVIRAQNSRLADVLCYLSCVAAEVLICSTLISVKSFSGFMDMVGLALFPAVVSNILYHYLSKRYGMLPNTAYRLIVTLYAYAIPYVPAVSDSLISFANIIVPIAIYWFIDSLYEKKRRYALGKKGRFSSVVTGITILLMAATVMLISNQFRFGALVIATDSMTGELNRGDAAIYERYEEQTIDEGQVIVFESNSSVTVHRVIDIKKVNGVVQYYTQGDANEDPDVGFITDGQIIGVVEMKVPYVGFPTLWLRGLFKK